MSGFKRIVLIIIGTFFVVIGLIGLLVPIMPTLPFLIIAGLCYINSSQKLYNQLIQMKYFGPTIKSYVEKHEISLKIKVSGLVIIWVSSLITFIFIAKAWYLRLVISIIVVGLSIYILTLKTSKTGKKMKTGEEK